MSRLLRTALTLLRWVVRSPELRKPKKADILIFDAELSELLIQYFGDRTYRVLHQRDRNLNIPILLRSLRRGLGLESYLFEYALAVDPKIVVSMLDNETSLYRLKDLLPHARIIPIQNGWRGITYDIFGVDFCKDERALAADNVLVFGPAVGRRFEACINTKTTSIGSFKSNLVPVHRSDPSRVVALVSTVREKVDLGRRVPVGSGHSAITYETIFQRRLELARYVHSFTRREGYHLRVLGKDSKLGREFDMYRALLGEPDESWSFTPRSTLLANYAEIDRAHAVISSSSTLGYEALGRGARSAFFMIDYEVLHDEGTRFGWPLELPDDGPFWSHTLSPIQVERVLGHVITSSDAEWGATSSAITSELITYDANNSIFTDLISRL